MLDGACSFEAVWLVLLFPDFISNLASLNIGVGVVIVDALKVFRLHAEPGESTVSLELLSNLSDEVFDKSGVVVSVFCDVFFVLSLEQSEQLAAGRMLDEGDDILDPEKFLEKELHSNRSPLIMCSPITDIQRTRADGTDRDLDPNVKLPSVVPNLSHVLTGVAHDALLPGNRRHLFCKIGKADLGECLTGVEIFANLDEHIEKVVHRYVHVVLVEYFNEPTHVGSLEVVPEVGVHVDGADRFLGMVLFVQNDDRISEVLDSYLFDVDLSFVCYILNVYHFSGS